VRRERGAEIGTHAERERAERERAGKQQSTIMHQLAETAPRERAERENERAERERTQYSQRRLPHLAADGAPIERERGARERERNTPPIMCGMRRSFWLMGRREIERERERSE
jgi:hypothetical protein